MVWLNGRSLSPKTHAVLRSGAGVCGLRRRSRVTMFAAWAVRAEHFARPALTPDAAGRARSVQPDPSQPGACTALRLFAGGRGGLYGRNPYQNGIERISIMYFYYAAGISTLKRSLPADGGDLHLGQRSVESAERDRRPEGSALGACLGSSSLCAYEIAVSQLVRPS
jgi:hypothetical protein